MFPLRSDASAKMQMIALGHANANICKQIAAKREGEAKIENDCRGCHRHRLCDGRDNCSAIAGVNVMTQ